MIATLSTAHSDPAMGARPYGTGTGMAPTSNYGSWHHGARKALAVAGAMAAYGSAALSGSAPNLPLPMQGSSNNWLACHNSASTQIHQAMHNLVVQQFLIAHAGADGQAVERIYQLARQAFGLQPLKGTEFEFWVDSDDNTPYLMLNIETGYNDVDARIEKELALRTQIANNEALLKASRYVVLTVV